MNYASSMTRVALLLYVLFGISAAASATEQPIQVETPTGTIKGTLSLPSAGTKFPVVLIIAGSGPTDQDGNAPIPAGKNDSLKLLSVALREAGVASVRYDKRGIAASFAAAPLEAELRFEDYVQDAASWIAKLGQDSRFTGVIVLGHSEGSLIGVLASLREPAAAFVSIAGPADRAAEILRRQLRGRLPPDLSARNEEILQSLDAGRAVSEVPAPLMALYRPSVQPYLISWFKYSPSSEITALKIPCLLLQGGTDIQVEISDAERLHAANTRCQLEVLPSMNHIMKTVPADLNRQIASYGDPTLPIDNDLKRALDRFLSSEELQSARRARR